MSVCLRSQEVVSMSWTYDPDLTDVVFGVEGKSSNGSRECLSRVYCIQWRSCGSRLMKLWKWVDRLIDARFYYDYDSWKQSQDWSRYPFHEDWKRAKESAPSLRCRQTSLSDCTGEIGKRKIGKASGGSLPIGREYRPSCDNDLGERVSRLFVRFAKRAVKKRNHLDITDREKKRCLRHNCITCLREEQIVSSLFMSV